MELLPEDVFLKIASHLQEADVCALGSCSRLWRESCNCDSLWESFARRRWPNWRVLCRGPSPGVEASNVDRPRGDPVARGWRNLYTTRHKEVAKKAQLMACCLEKSLVDAKSVEIGLYKKVLAELKSLELSFVDVKMLLFKPKDCTVLHLVGLHYCFTFLNVPVEDMVKAVVDSEISENQVCVRWWTLGWLLNGIRMREESQSRIVSLLDVASSRDHEVLWLLSRGAVHEVTRVQISL